MSNLAFTFDQSLPSWLAKTELQWVQWIYALWQLLRCNPIVILVLSVLPFYLRQRCQKKKVLVLGFNRENYGPKRLDDGLLASQKVEIIRDDLLESLYWTWVKYNGYFYITHKQTLEELCGIIARFDNNIIFVESVMPISGSLSVGKQISQTTAYERIFSKDYHCSSCTKHVIPTWLDYVEVSSKFWGILSTIPILLQAKDYVKLSNLVCLVLFLLDFNRHWLYNIYDNLFNRVTKFVKLNIFKDKTFFYIFFAIFSDRWKCEDLQKKHAYVAHEGELVNLIYDCKLERKEDLEIDRIEEGTIGEKIFMCIYKDRAHCKLRANYPYPYPVAELRRDVYVP